MRNVALRNEAVRYISLSLSTEAVFLDPWGCFGLIAWAAKHKGVDPANLELRNVEDKIGSWRLTFEVLEPRKPTRVRPVRSPFTAVG